MGRKETAAALALLAETWPACFSIYEKRRRPLKIGIHNDILATLDGAVTPAGLSRALRIYTGNKVYRSRLRIGAVRVGLDGEPAGEVAPDQVPAPVKREKNKEHDVPNSKSQKTPRRLSLADLREAAKRRREKAAAVS
jgi:ProP effector